MGWRISPLKIGASRLYAPAMAPSSGTLKLVRLLPSWRTWLMESCMLAHQTVGCTHYKPATAPCSGAGDYLTLRLASCPSPRWLMGRSMSAHSMAQHCTSYGPAMALCCGTIELSFPSLKVHSCL